MASLLISVVILQGTMTVAGFVYGVVVSLKSKYEGHFAAPLGPFWGAVQLGMTFAMMGFCWPLTLVLCLNGRSFASKK